MTSTTVSRKKQLRPTYPPNAPNELCELYEIEKRKEINHYVNLLGTILGQNDDHEFKAMDGVWREMTKRGMTGEEAIWWLTFVVYPSVTGAPDSKQGAVEKQHNEHSQDLMKAFAEHRPEFSRQFKLPQCPRIWAKLTRGEKEERIKDIAGAASILYKLLEHTPFDRSIFRYIGEDIAKNILKVFRESPTYLTDVDQGSMTDLQFLESIQHRPKVTDFLFNLRLLALQRYVKGMPTPRGKKKYRPTLPCNDLLGDDLVKNPNIGNADRNYFILRMAEYFKMRFGATLYGTITTLARVVLNEPTLTKNAVTTVIRSASK